MGRYELNDNLVKIINGRKPRWYHKYDNEDVLSLVHKENSEYWHDIESLEDFYQYYP